MSKIGLIILLTLPFISCNFNSENEFTKSLEGEWALIVEDNVDSPYISSSRWKKNEGFGIKGNQIEFFKGFSKTTKNPLTGIITTDSRGNFTDYKVRGDTLYIKNPFNENWQFKWRIKKVSQDTLIFTINDTWLIKYKRLEYDLNSDEDFDQIIFSRSGCFGTCPIFDLSIDKNNEVWFYGEGFVKPLGFFQSQIDSSQTKFIFDKFRKTDFKNLSETYTGNATDGECITTTFIKNGQVQKTIRDYRRKCPKELFWAYISIEYLYNSLELKQVINNNPYYQKLHYYTFDKDSLSLELTKAESFFLWTELKKAPFTEEDFTAKYKIRFAPNHIYYPLSGAELSVENAINQRKEWGIGKIESNGQYFRFHFKTESL